MNRPMLRPMPRSMPPALLALTAMASIATSQAHFQISDEVIVDPLVWEDGAVPFSLSVETTGQVRRSDLTDLSVSFDLDNPSDDSVRLSLVQLPAPWDGALPPEAEVLDSLMVRGTLDGEPGHFSGELHAGIDVPAQLYLVLLTDGAEVDGRATLALSAFFSEAPEGEVRLEVAP